MQAVARPRVLVFQPLFTHGAPLDYRILGVQYWLAKRLAQLGFEGASTLMKTPDMQSLLATEAPSDSDIRATLETAQAQFGLLMSFAVLGDHPRLALARLYEGGSGRAFRGSVRITFDGETNHLPAAAFRLLCTVAERLGERVEDASWSEAFGSTDVSLASNYLTALGCHSSCEAGIPFDDPDAALRALLSGVHRGIQPHLELLPALVESLRNRIRGDGHARCGGRSRRRLGPGPTRELATDDGSVWRRLSTVTAELKLANPAERSAGDTL